MAYEDSGFYKFLQSPGTMPMAMGLLAASGPSRTPVSFGQAMGRGLGAYQQGVLADQDRQIKAQKFEQDKRFQDAQIAKMTAETATGGTRPMSVKEWEYFSTLSPADQQRYLTMKRQEKFLDVGGSFVQPTPGKPGEVSQQIDKTVAPELKPRFKATSKQAETTGGEIAGINTKQYEAAVTAVGQIKDIDRLIDHIDTSDAITGLGATVFKNLERVKARLGSDVSSGKVKDTELLDVMMGAEVFPMIKALGVGARGMDTPAEREFMRKVLTGEISLDKQTLSEMANIRRSVAERAIKKWNSRIPTGELDIFFESSGIPKKEIQYGKTPTNKTITVTNPQTGQQETWDLTTEKRVK